MAKKDEVEKELRQSVDKIRDLREVIEELEKQLDTKSKIEVELRQVCILKIYILVLFLSLCLCMYSIWLPTLVWTNEKTQCRCFLGKISIIWFKVSWHI